VAVGVLDDSDETGALVAAVCGAVVAAVCGAVVAAVCGAVVAAVCGAVVAAEEPQASNTSKRAARGMNITVRGFFRDRCSIGWPPNLEFPLGLIFAW